MAARRTRPGRGAGQGLILDLYGLYIRRLGGWLAVSDLVSLAGRLGADDQAVRSAVSRMVRGGLLAPERRGSCRGYGLTAIADRLLEEADRRISSAVAPAELAHGWALVSFSVPESERHKRHLLRSRLTWLGFGRLSGALWIAPTRSLPTLREVVRELGFERYVDVFVAHYRGFGSPTALVRRSWDLERLEGHYRAFIAEHEPLLARDREHREPEACFVDYTLTVHAWRRLPHLDPGLPPELLPPGWAGQAAADLLRTIRLRLEAPAIRYVEGTVAGTGDDPAWEPLPRAVLGSHEPPLPPRRPSGGREAGPGHLASGVPQGAS
ncbi:MAG TPA: PaaX family transcriptional regulator C-terminal domain-containing protein [Candidatus Dormibacteraeota bacterium]|jgi:phenylacetic acid degradation operon negative regulatory protein|nr:PaaX family transcriptional regulator C-terminal domain-containing protein [Candidatus Dormibacteraeota bacterium]